MFLQYPIKSADYSSFVNVNEHLQFLYDLYSHWTFSYFKNICVKGG